MTNVYLALYKGKKDGRGINPFLIRLRDGFMRKITRGKYSHCEIAIETENSGEYRCFSSSIRDGGVRMKVIPLPSEKWDLTPVPSHVAMCATKLFNQTKGRKYDYMGAIGLYLGISHEKKRWFCSEWCGAALNINEAWRFDPNGLAAIVNQKHNGVHDGHSSQKP